MDQLVNPKKAGKQMFIPYIGPTNTHMTTILRSYPGISKGTKLELEIQFSKNNFDSTSGW